MADAMRSTCDVRDCDSLAVYILSVEPVPVMFTPSEGGADWVRYCSEHKRTQTP